jgi:uncharacterized protein (TIGR02391 family)
VIDISREEMRSAMIDSLRLGQVTEAHRWQVTTLGTIVAEELIRRELLPEQSAPGSKRLPETLSDLFNDVFHALINEGILRPGTGSGGNLPFFSVTRAGADVLNQIPSAAGPLPVTGEQLRALLTDQELRERCERLLRNGPPFDTAVREACVVLEDRVRSAANLPAALTGGPVMQKAFGTSGPLQLRSERNEQVGAMQLYSGIIAFVRNVAGHHLSNTDTAVETIQIIVFIDWLLSLVTRAQAAQGSSPTTGPVP